MKDFNRMNDQVGLGDTDDCFGISFESINEPGLPLIRHGSI
jgi:hypothetical protein